GGGEGADTTVPPSLPSPRPVERILPTNPNPPTGDRFSGFSSRSIYSLSSYRIFPSYRMTDDVSTPICNFSSLADHKQEHMDIMWITNSISLPLIALMGVTCNILNVVILTAQRGARRMPSWNLLVALSICDTLFLLFALLETSPLGVKVVTTSPLLNRIYAHSVLYVRSAASTFYKSSILIVVAFNIERFVYVVCPFRASRMCTERASRMAIGISFLISFACSLQWPLCYRVRVCLDPRSGSPLHSIVMSDSPALQSYYSTLDNLTLLMFNLLPIVLLLTLNMKLIFTLKRVAKEDSKRGGLTLSEESPSSRSTANAMLFAVVGILLVCLGSQAPARMLFSLFGQYHPHAILYACISQQLVFLNASLNFALYCVVSKRYRDLMRATFARFCDRLPCCTTIGKHPYGSSISNPRTRTSKLQLVSSSHAYDHFPLILQPRGSIQSNPELPQGRRPTGPTPAREERRESAPLLVVPHSSALSTSPISTTEEL
ncbi:hypothetical protein PRIPAC_89452, partial [Pristionchus pacificus]